MSKVVKPPRAPKGKSAGEAEVPAVSEIPKGPIPVPRLKVLYNTELKARLMQQLQLENINRVPRLTKISINAGLGEGIKEYKVIEEMARENPTLGRRTNCK